MMRRAVPLVLVSVLLGLAGCGGGATPPATTNPPGGSSASAAGSPSASASASSSADVVEFSVDGAGPYTFGSKLADLQAAGKLAQVTAGTADCPNTTTALGTGKFSQIQLSFHQDGTLYLLQNQSTDVPTPSGAYLGTTLTDLKRIYALTTNETLNRAGTTAFLVITINGRGILFTLSSNQMVVSMAAADSGYLRLSFNNGTPFC
jgi:hypothetical protein